MLERKGRTMSMLYRFEGHFVAKKCEGMRLSVALLDHAAHQHNLIQALH